MVSLKNPILFSDVHNKVVYPYVLNDIQHQLTGEQASKKNDRDNQEDAAFVFPLGYNDVLIGLVCDGLGGHPHGELASNEVVDTLYTVLADQELTAELFEPAVTQALIEASTKLKDHLDGRDSTLLLAAVFPREGVIRLANVGDGMAVFRQQDVYKLTTIQGNGAAWVWHTVHELAPEYIGWYTWDFNPAEPFNLALMSDGCDPLPPQHAVNMTADRIVEKASLLGRRGLRDNATAITIHNR